MKRSIELNHRKHPYRDGMTISSLMAEKNYDHNYINIVKVNGAVIEEGAWDGTAVSAGDKVEMIHLFGGG